jgi:predicted Zn finger-like uncharacterized protein
MLAGGGPGRHIARAMRIVCPACAAAYEVPDHLIGTGRSLRCRTCGHAWHVQPEATVAAEPPPAAVPPTASLPAPPPPVPGLPPGGPLPSVMTPGLRRPPQPIEPPLPRPDSKRGGGALRLAWAASLLAVAGTVVALWVFRAEISAAWPPAARLYLMLGTVAQG